MTLNTERLTMVPFTDDDLGFLHQLWTNEHVRRFLWDGRVISQQEAQEVVALSRQSFVDHDYGFWVIRETETDVAVGFAGLREFGSEHEVELLYGLLPDFCGRGYATEAAWAVLEHGFHACGLRQIHAGTDPPNRESIRVIERLGMTHDGLREIDGVPAVYYSLRSDAIRSG